MRNVFRLLGVILEAIVGVVDEKPRKNLSAYEAQERLDSGMMGISEYNDVVRGKHP